MRRQRAPENLAQRGRGALRVAAVVVIACQVLDLWSTHALLKIGGTELNPVASYMLASGWLGWTKILIALAIVVLVFAEKKPPVSLVAGVWAVVGYYCAVVLNNVLTLNVVA